ncbi:hypothetical protein CUMW_147860 [Citrus unshiu]|nr:hypothetical protein CUMW_147860 [Citrus unshiu]
MEKARTKSALKFVKAGSQSAGSWSTTANGMAKENTKPQEFTLHTQQRAVKRAMFNYSVATKLYLEQVQRKRVEKLQKMIEEEEIRLMRKEMIPRAQLMPLFDRPFFPQREPSFRMANNCWSCISNNEIYNFEHSHAWKPLK